MTERNKDGFIPGAIVSDDEFFKAELARKQQQAEQPKEGKKRGRPKASKAD